MKQRIITLLCAALVLSFPVWGASVYNRFLPGGDLSGTWNNQQVVGAHLSAPLPLAQGGLGLSTAADDTIPISSGTAWVASALPGCLDTGGNHLNYNASTNTLSCGNTGNSTASGSNPTASVGLTAVNGVSTSYMRADGAPALSLAIAPNFASPWTGGPWVWSNTEPRLVLYDSDQGTDLKAWDLDTNSGVTCLRTRTDADAAGLNGLCLTRGTTTNISSITIGNTTSNPSVTISGTGTFSAGNGGTSIATGGVLTTGVVIVNNSSTPANGIYRPSANTLGFASNSSSRGNFDSTGNFNVNVGIQAAGTKFTTSGCSVSATTGGAWAGTFTLGANSCNVVITLAGASGATATNGWTCDAHDRTSPTVLIGGESSSTTTTATIAIPAGAGTTDVISFHCHEF